MHAEDLLPVNGLIRKTKLDQIQLHCIIKQAKPNDNSSLIKRCSEEGQLSTPLPQSAPPTGSSTRRVAGHTDLVSAATAEGADALYLVSLESEFWVRVRKGEAVGLPFLGWLVQLVVYTLQQVPICTSQPKVQGSFKDGYF